MFTATIAMTVLLLLLLASRMCWCLVNQDDDFIPTSSPIPLDQERKWMFVQQDRR